MSDFPRYLYHGTSSESLSKILKGGIMPRSVTLTKGNWEDHPSNRGAIYLTTAYAPYYALCALGQDEGSSVVFRIDTWRLDHKYFAPDEDALEQVGRKYDAVKGDLKERTAHYRDNLKQWMGIESASLSLKALGNCTYFRNIPLEAISDFVIIDKDSMVKFVLEFGIDPIITLMNYSVCGAKYIAFTEWMFGQGPEIGCPRLDVLTLSSFKEAANDE